jgi:hypothetical protein
MSNGRDHNTEQGHITPATTNQATPSNQSGPGETTADGTTQDDPWVFFTVEANLYSEGSAPMSLSETDLTAAFPIRISHAQDVQVHEDHYRPVTMIIPIKIQFRMKKADADNVDDALERILQLELARLLIELHDQGGRMVDKLAWMQLQGVRAVPVSNIWRTDEPDEKC